MEILSFGWNYLFSIIAISIAVVIPVCTGLLYMLCTWFDDGEETFEYPSICKHKMYCFAKGEHDYKNSFGSSIGWLLIPGALLCFVNAVVVQNPGINFDFTKAVLYILSACAVMCLSRACIRGGKKFKKHCLNPDAHKDVPPEDTDRLQARAERLAEKHKASEQKEYSTSRDDYTIKYSGPMKPSEKRLPKKGEFFSCDGHVRRADYDFESCKYYILERM